MEKVKLTQEQAEDLEEALHAYEDDKDHMLNVFVRAKDTSDWGSISHFSPSKIAKALYIGYEVELEFKAGDWVKVFWSNSNPSIHKLLSVDDEFARIDGDQLNKMPPKDIIGKPTSEEIEKEKECRWWFRHNRDVWELREGDILTDGYHVSQVNNANKSIVWFRAPFNKGYEYHEVKEKFKVD